MAPPDAGENGITLEQPQNPRRLRAVEPAPRSPERPLHNLPSELSSFVGREKELPEVKRLLENNCLLTLTGSEGALTFAALGLAFWKRSLVWGLAVVDAAILFKIDWTFLFSTEAGAMSHLPAAVLGLAVCDAMILYVIRRMRVRSSY
jgi:hypothetical protein